MGYIFEDLFQGKSSLPPHPVLTRPNAIRWDRDQPLTLYNCVIMPQELADRHEKECLVEGQAVRDVWGDNAVLSIERRLREARQVAEWRQS